MKYKIVLIGLIFLACTDNIEAGRFGKGRSSGRGSHHYSSHSSHTSHSSSSHSSYSPPSSPSISHSTSHTSSINRDKSASSSLIAGERHHSGTQSKPKPSAPAEPPSYSDTLFNYNPSSTFRDKPIFGNSHSDKPAWSNPNYNPSVDLPSFSNPSLSSFRDKSTFGNFHSDKPAWSNPMAPSPVDLSPYKNPLTSFNPPPFRDKPTFGNSHSDKPAWSNPNYNPSSSNPPYPSNSNLPGSSTSGGTQGGRHHHPVSSHRHPSAHGYNNSASVGAHNSTVTTNHLQQSSSHPGKYDPLPPYPPFPSSSKPLPYPTGTGSISQPNSKVSAPYPVGTGSMPQPGHTGNIGFHPSVSQPNYNTMSQPNLATPHYNPPLSQGYHPSMAQPAFNPHFSHGQPSYGQPSYHPNMAQPGGYYPQPVYQPAPPASGPVIIMADQQSSGGRGLGQMIAEAAVFSTINAGVNRLINPYPSYHHDYHSGSSSQTAQSTSTTHITYNNYLNGQPINPSQMQSGVSTVPGTVPGAFSIGTLPPGANPALYPGGINNVNTLPNSGGGYAPVISGVGTSGSTYNSNGNSGTNVPAPGIVTKVNPSNKNEPLSPPVNPLNDSSLVIYGISNAEFWKLTEDLFEKQEFNVSEFIKTNLQKKANSTEDVASEPLFKIEKGAFELPTVRAVRDTFNVFESDSRIKENKTLERKQKENILLDTMMNTDVMDTAMSWLTSKRFLDPDDFERKDTLRHIWFNLFDGSSSGFERVFVAETLHTADSAVILGVQDWLSFSHLEEEKRINYAGYVDQIHLGNNSSLLKLNYKMNDLVVSNTTILVGTLPELEMALYTVCFYARPGIECPVSLGGTKFNLYTHMMPYFGKYLIAAAYPSI